jgi:hypothetical protein
VFRRRRERKGKETGGGRETLTGDDLLLLKESLNLPVVSALVLA